MLLIEVPVTIQLDFWFQMDTVSSRSKSLAHVRTSDFPTTDQGQDSGNLWGLDLWKRAASQDFWKLVLEHLGSSFLEHLTHRCPNHRTGLLRLSSILVTWARLLCIFTLPVTFQYQERSGNKQVYYILSDAQCLKLCLLFSTKGRHIISFLRGRKPLVMVLFHWWAQIPIIWRKKKKKVHLHRYPRLFLYRC